MYDVFVSYASEDRGRADTIAAALERDGLTCWIAPRDIAPGSSWADAIAVAIGEARAALFVVSAHSSRSRHVAREAERADRHRLPLVPVLVEDVEPEGALGYYFGSTHWVSAHPGSLDAHVAGIVGAMRQALTREGVRRSASISRLDDEDLVALARSITWDVRPLLVGTASPEDVITIHEPKAGQQVKFIDLAAVKMARRSVADWVDATGTSVHLSGEDIAPIVRPDAPEPILCVLDALDGTQHWIRGRTLWCTALSLFRQTDEGYQLRVSTVQTADGTLYIAREDTRRAFVDGESTPLVTDTADVAIDQAHVCTVSRRPDHYRVLARHLRRGSPFAGLYTFGGNPILVELALGRYDAVFQPDASDIDDDQELWDWLPGGHIAQRAGATILGLDGEEIDVPSAAADAVAGRGIGYPFVAAADPMLARATVRWLREH